MKRTKPPFRADHVGSFLRPAALKEARAKREKGEITAAQLKEVEDREIEKIISKQEEIGLQLATDGEFRRVVVAFRFPRHARRRRARSSSTTASSSRACRPRRRACGITGKIGFSQPSDAGAFPVPQGAHARHAEDDDPEPERAAFPARARRDRHEGLSRPRRVLRRSRPGLPARRCEAFYDAGCRYLQFDDTVWAYLCSQEELHKARERGDRRRPAAGASMPASSTRRSKASPPT